MDLYGKAWMPKILISHLWICLPDWLINIAKGATPICTLAHLYPCVLVLLKTIISVKPGVSHLHTISTEKPPLADLHPVTEKSPSLVVIPSRHPPQRQRREPLHLPAASCHRYGDGQRLLPHHPVHGLQRGGAPEQAIRPRGARLRLRRQHLRGRLQLRSAHPPQWTHLQHPGTQVRSV